MTEGKNAVSESDVITGYNTDWRVDEVVKTRISPAEASARADAIYERSIRALVKESDRMKYLYIDIESGDFEMDANEDLAEERIRARRPDGVFFVMRANGGGVGHFGFSMA